MARVRLAVLGSTLDVSCEAGTAEALRHLFAPFLTDAADGPARVLDLDGCPLPAAVSRINEVALTGAAYLAVHAGVVARGGRAVAFAGASGAGKSTLTAACLRAGLDYVSDEALCLRWEDGAGGDAVQPYPRPIALSPWAARALGLPVPPTPQAGFELLVTAGDLGARLATPPLRLAHLVLLERGGAGPRGPRPQPRSAGAAELLRRSFTHWHRPERAFELAHQVLADASVWSLRTGDPAGDAAAVAGLLG
jgi:hypothetical protein